MPPRKHPLEARVASGEILDARRERVAHIGEERAVVVDAGHDGIRALDDGPVDAVLESHGGRSDERPDAAAHDRVVGDLIREANPRHDAVEHLFPEAALRLLVAVHQLERARYGCPVTGFVRPSRTGLIAAGLKVTMRSSFSLKTPGISHRTPRFNVSLLLTRQESSRSTPDSSCGRRSTPTTGRCPRSGCPGGTMRTDPRSPRVGSVERRRRVAEVERSSGRVVLEVVLRGPQDVGAELERVTAGNLRQRRRHRVRLVVGVDQTGADEAVRTGGDRSGSFPFRECRCALKFRRRASSAARTSA